MPPISFLLLVLKPFTMQVPCLFRPLCRLPRTKTPVNNHPTLSSHKTSSRHVFALPVARKGGSTTLEFVAVALNCGR